MVYKDFYSVPKADLNWYRLMYEDLYERGSKKIDCHMSLSGRDLIKLLTYKKWHLSNTRTTEEDVGKYIHLLHLGGKKLKRLVKLVVRIMRVYNIQSHFDGAYFTSDIEFMLIK